MKILKYLTAGLACIALLTGCFSVPDDGKNFNSENVSKIKIGESTEADVIALVGEPINRTRSADGSVTLTYQHTAYKGTVSLINPFDVGQNVNTKSRSLTVMVGRDGKVTNYFENSGN